MVVVVGVVVVVPAGRVIDGEGRVRRRRGGLEAAAEDKVAIGGRGRGRGRL